MNRKQITPFKRIDIYAFDKARYNTIKDMQKYVRKNGCEDYIVVDNILYTMEEYDESGKQIEYYNKRTNNMIMVETSNRYNKEIKFSDAVVELYNNYGVYRNDISYAD